MTDLEFFIRYIRAGNANIHYIESGSPTLPTLLLLHGFPSSAFQFRTLIPLLAPYYHVIAPTFPGFGNTIPEPGYTYTFASLAQTLADFLVALGIRSYAAYIFDYGAPILFRLALNQPPGTSLTAIISQNGNAYVQGLGNAYWAPVRSLWESGNSDAARDWIREHLFTLEATEQSQYRAGVPDAKQALVDPSTYTLDYLENLAPASGRQDVQLDLLYDYRKNVELYPAFQEWMRKQQIPLLAVWGKGDPCFVAAGAEAFKEDLPHAKIRLLDAGHFAVLTDAEEIAREVCGFLTSIGY